MGRPLYQRYGFTATDDEMVAFTAMGKELYLEKLANAILNHGDVE